jgi:hypothetical protein
VRATTGVLLKLEVVATDGDDGDVLKFALTRYPEGMDIDGDSGAIEWTPNADQTGDRAVTVQVTDGIESATYSFNIDVRQGEDVSSPAPFIAIGAIALLLVIAVGVVIFMILRKKGPKPEEQAEIEEDESARIAAEMERHKQEMDGTAPKSGEAMAIVAASPAEANANLGKDRPKSYKEMYGTPAPKEEEGLTAAELKHEIGKMADQLEKENRDPAK